jgi:hypothetical protein
VTLAPLAVALPDNSDYVAAAYIVFVLLLLIYLAIMATKLSRIEKETAELVALSDAQERQRAESGAVTPAERTGST